MTGNVVTNPVYFENSDGLKLFGFMHQPPRTIRRETAIILLSPGVKTRIGPNRLYIHMARRFVELGFCVFRFDYYGLGESEGEIEQKFLADFYNSVALGRYISDTKFAINYLEKEYGISKIILSGLCGGALTGLLSGYDDDRVIGLLGLGIPCVLDQTQSNSTQNITQGQLKRLRSSYIKKIFSPKSWLRLLTFKTNFAVLYRSLFSSKATKKKKNVSSADRALDKVDLTQGSNINPKFAPAFFSMAEASKKMMLIFSGADRLGWEFKEKFAEPCETELEKIASVYETYTVENANHVFSMKEWRDEMLDQSSDWLLRYFPNTHN